jgi:hypothetical protein
VLAKPKKGLGVPQADWLRTMLRERLETALESSKKRSGIAHREAGVGQIGAGLVRPPMKVFEDALLAYAERYGL